MIVCYRRDTCSYQNNNERTVEEILIVFVQVLFIASRLNIKTGAIAILTNFDTDWWIDIKDL